MMDRSQNSILIYLIYLKQDSTIVAKRETQYVSPFPLLRLQISIFAYDILDAGARLRGVEVMVTYDAGAGVTPVQVFKEPSHGSLLLGCPCVDFFTTGIQTALIAHTDAVLVVVLPFDVTVGADHPFRPARFYASVTTDDVVVADALKSPVLMPVIYFLCRTCLVGPYRTAMNNNQTNLTHLSFIICHLSFRPSGRHA